MSEHPHDDEPIEFRVYPSGDGPYESWVIGAKAAVLSAMEWWAKQNPLPHGTLVSVDLHVKVEMPDEQP